MDNKIIYNKIHNGILEIKNFLSIDECNSLVKIVESFPESSWKEDQYENWDKRNLKKDIKNIELDAIRNKIAIKVIDIFESFFMIDPSHNYVSIHRILPNTNGLSEHRDNFIQKTLKYGLVLYYNDDYLGGELEYPELNISHKPLAGSLLIHDAGLLHKVNEVYEKTRYMSTFFIHENDEVLALLKPEHKKHFGVL